MFKSPSSKFDTNFKTYYTNNLLFDHVLPVMEDVENAVNK